MEGEKEFMKIKKVKIKNFKSIVDCEFEFPDLLALIGENNVGKSNIIYALELFFNKNKPDGLDDFFDKTTPIEITITFSNLTEFEKEKITEDHREEDSFVLRKIYPPDADTRTTSVKEGTETNIPPRGPQNILADTLPELYILPAVKDVTDEIKLVSTTNFGKFLNLVLETSESDFEEVDELLTQMKEKLESDEENAPLSKAGSEISEILQRQFQDTKVKLKPKTITRKDLLKSLDVIIDNGHESVVFQKGHGLQRAFIFAVLQLWANKLNEQRPDEGKDKKDIIIVIEEPELYLHPHQQKIIYSIFKQLSEQEAEQVQIIYSTHSSFLIHIEDYQNIALIRKPSIEIGTKLTQYTQEIFPPDSRKDFSLLCQFDPERNEMFFAKKIIFVEGDTERMNLPLILNKLGINVIERSISIVECGSKGGIKLFAEVLNKFNEKEKLLGYIIMHDKDIPWRDGSDPEKEKKEKQAEKENEEIKETCVDAPIYMFDPDFERELGLTLGDKNKPFKARKAVDSMDVEQFPEKLKTFFTTNL